MPSYWSRSRFVLTLAVLLKCRALSGEVQALSRKQFISVAQKGPGVRRQLPTHVEMCDKG